MSATTEVWKFDLASHGLTAISMPDGAGVLTAQNQDGKLRLWARVDPSREEVTRDFYTAMTGEPIGFARCELVYLASVQFDKGLYVVHVFELVR